MDALTAITKVQKYMYEKYDEAKLNGPWSQNEFCFARTAEFRNKKGQKYFVEVDNQLNIFRVAVVFDDGNLADI